MKGAENTELCSLDGLSLKTREIFVIILDQRFRRVSLLIFRLAKTIFEIVPSQMSVSIMSPTPAVILTFTWCQLPIYFH